MSGRHLGPWWPAPGRGVPRRAEAGACLEASGPGGRPEATGGCRIGSGRECSWSAWLRRAPRGGDLPPRWTCFQARPASARVWLQGLSFLVWPLNVRIQGNNKKFRKQTAWTQKGRLAASGGLWGPRTALGFPGPEPSAALSPRGSGRRPRPAPPPASPPPWRAPAP